MPVARRVLWAVPVAVVVAGSPSAGADPDILWRVVNDQCVAGAVQSRDPAPCAAVDLSGGRERGYVVFKDSVGPRQYLLLPTARITGIESPDLLDPGATNYFAAAWAARSFTEAAAGGTLPRDWMSLAVNSASSRSQNQLHIHIDCIRSDVHAAITEHADALGPHWARFPEPLAGHTYSAIAVDGEELSVNPFRLLADTAGADIGHYTLVVVGVRRGGLPGFVILADQADSAAGDWAGGEELQDHDRCPPPSAGGK